MLLKGYIRYQCAATVFEQNFAIDPSVSRLEWPHLETHIALAPLPGPGFRLQLSLEPERPIVLLELQLQQAVFLSGDSKLFCNGFQSWSQSREFGPEDRHIPLKPFAAGLMRPYGDYGFHRYTGKRGHLHSWTYTYARKASVGASPAPQNDSGILFWGSLNEHSAYTLFKWHAAGNSLQIAKDCAGLQLSAAYAAFDLLYLQAPEAEAFGRYFECLYKTGKTPARAAAAGARPAGEAGWTSWYHYYTRISEAVVLENLEAFSRLQLPIRIFQIDDGWQQAVGDWLTVKRDKFPRGMSFLAGEIQRAGLRAGLWLAPFIVEKKSDLYRNRKEWLLRHEDGALVKAGYNVAWRGTTYALNFYHPEVRAYLQEVFGTVLRRWGFDLLKLDFLYAAALHAPPDKTRGQVMCEVMDWLRALSGDKWLLGCGVPLGSAFGRVDFCRTGADVHLRWDMKLLKWLGSRERVSTLNSLKNTIFRRQLNGHAFVSDPDVSILRSTNNKLSPEERYTLFMLNQLLGSLQFVSDPVGQYDAATLALYKSQFPLRVRQIDQVDSGGQFFVIRFRIGSLRYAAYSNLGKKARKVVLPHAAFHNRLRRVLAAGTPLTLAPRQSCCLLAIDTDQPYALAGSMGHLFPASEVARFSWEQNRLTVAWEEELLYAPHVFIYVADGKAAVVNGRLLKPVEMGGLPLIEYRQKGEELQ